MEQFLEKIYRQTPSALWTDEARAALEEIANNLEMDLSVPIPYFFSLEDQQEITMKAASDLSLRLSSKTETLNREILQSTWLEVVRSFHQSDHWGFQTAQKKPKKAPNEQQKIARELFLYIGFLVLILFIFKSAFFIFGMLGSNYNDNPVYQYGFWISVAALVVVSILFGWKKFKDPQ